MSRQHVGSSNGLKTSVEGSSWPLEILELAAGSASAGSVFN